MKALLGLVVCVLAAAAAPAVSAALAAPALATPSILIKSPKNGAVIHGSSINVTVAVSNFKLVDASAHPNSRGNEGHIQYVLDDLTTYSADHNIAASLSHTWKNVRPGHHTLIAYLATSQQLPFPTARQAEVTVQVVGAAPAKQPRSKPTLTARPRAPGVGAAPTTGGGAGTISGPLNVYMLIFGIFLLAVGLLFLGRRYAFATTGGHAMPVRDDRPVPEARVVLEPQPAATAPELPSVAAFSAFDQVSSADDQPAAAPQPEPRPTAPPPQQQQYPFGSVEHVPEPVPRPAHWDVPPLVHTAPSPPTYAHETQSSPADAAGLELTRTRALEMAQQWSSVVQDLVRQLERQEAERQEMLARISALEHAVRAHESLRGALAESSADRLSQDDIRAVQYVTDSLLRDPDHIVVLASVAQHAEQLARVVSNYARIQRALGES